MTTFDEVQLKYFTEIFQKYFTQGVGFPKKTLLTTLYNPAPGVLPRGVKVNVEVSTGSAKKDHFNPTVFVNITEVEKSDNQFVEQKLAGWRDLINHTIISIHGTFEKKKVKFLMFFSKEKEHLILDTRISRAFNDAQFKEVKIKISRLIEGMDQDIGMPVEVVAKHVDD